jgi:hypothetical protein
MTERENMQDKIICWMLAGRVGESSKAMAIYLGWGKCAHPIAHPWDPDDLNRCLLLLACVPELRAELPHMAKTSTAWRGLIEHWAEIEATFVDEAGLNWQKAQRAPRTYCLMKSAMERYAPGRAAADTSAPMSDAPAVIGYRSGSDRNEPRALSHTYAMMADGELWPMCDYGWNRSNGEAFSIFRGSPGTQGDCKLCRRNVAAGLRPVLHARKHKTKWL